MEELKIEHEPVETVAGTASVPDYSDKAVQNNDKAVSETAKPEKKKNKRRRRVKGLGSLQQEKTGIWTVRAWINGKRVSKSTGTTDKGEAEAFLKEYMRPYVKGDAERTYDNIQALVESDERRAERLEDEKPQLTLAAAFDAYKVSPLHRDLAESTLDGKMSTWKVFREWMQEHHADITEVRGVKFEHVEEYLADLRREHAASTYNNRVCVLREMFRVLMAKARAKVNPFDGVKLLEDDTHVRREFTIEELQRIVECARREGDEYRKLFGIAIYTGLRFGDCCKLNWKSVDVVRSIIQLIPEKTKRHAHGKPVTIPIHPTLALMFQETPVDERTGYVLPTLADLYANRRHVVCHRVKRIFTDSGIVTSVNVEGRKWKAPEATFHSLRHTFVSLSANAGVPLHIIQSIVGHESTTMTRHYFHENEAALRQAVAAIPMIGETYGAKDSPMPFVKPDPTTLVPQAPATRYSLEHQAFVARPQAIDVTPQPAPVAALPVQTVTQAQTAAVPVETQFPVSPTPIPRETDPAHPRAPFVPPPLTPDRPRPPKSQWLSELMKLYALKHQKGVLDGTMGLVRNGGYKFLATLWERGACVSTEDAFELMDAYLIAKGAV